MLLSTVGKYISLSWEMTKSNIMSAMEYRASFLTKVIGMIINDLGLILLWIIFFQKFPSVNGWTLQESNLLFAIGTCNFALVMIFAGGAGRLSKTIANGELDYFLSLPKNVLWHISVSRTDISSIGDFIFGMGIFFFSGNISPEKFLIFLAIIFITACCYLNFIIITQSIGFFVGNFEQASMEIFHGILGFSLYPQSVFSGLLKIITFTILPAFFIYTLPVEIVQNLDWSLIPILLAFWAVSFILAIFIFKKGLKKYESGNLINLRI